MKNIYLLVFIAALFFSCGPNAEEKAAHDKFVADSVANAIKMQEMFQDSLKKLEALKVENETGQRKDEEDMNVANSKMSSIQDFQFLRTGDEKEQQIRAQTQVIQTIRDNSEIHRKNIEIINQRIEAVKNELMKYQR